MVSIPNLLVTAGKKGGKAFSKKKAREENDTIDELLTLINPIPFDAKSLNVGEDERIREINEKWKRQKEDKFEKNQSKMPDGKFGRAPLIQKFKQTPIPEEPYYKKQIQNPEFKERTSNNYNNIIKAIEENNNSKEDILYKHPNQIPEKELKESMAYAGYETKNPELKQALQKKSQEWFEHYYSTEPVTPDATGKNIQPKANFQFPNDIVEATSKDNVPMSEAFKQIAEKTTLLSVKSLQKGLNNLYANEYNKPQLKEDNVLGSKSISRMKEALANFGVDKVKRHIGVGGLNSFLEDNRKKSVDNELLKNTITSIKPEDGGSFLQKGLNSLGTSLKEDNDIGPKTTSAFNQIKDKKEDDLLSYFKKNLI